MDSPHPYDEGPAITADIRPAQPCFRPLCVPIHSHKTLANKLMVDIFETLYAGSTVSTAAVRRPKDNSPISNITSLDMRCNFDLYKATETVAVAAGSRVGFRLGEDKTVYHMGPASIWLGKAPGRAADWDGSGKAWFKVSVLLVPSGELYADGSSQIAHWGAEFIPKFTFISLNKREFYTTIPESVPSGEVCCYSFDA
jgi:Auxiliary Activity family 9 (formerly GH61)